MSLYDVFLQPWAIRKDALRSISTVLVRHARGEKLQPEQVEQIVSESPARARERSRAGREVPQNVAVIPVQGVIARHSREVNGVSTPRGTSVETMRSQLQAALADDSIEGIVLDVDSPGGTAMGLVDLANDIRAARAQKPVSAHVDGMSASAAYWLASQADRVFATRDSEIGSIGVYAPVVDDHRLYEAAGVDVDVVSSGGVKGQGYPGTKLSDAARAELQASVDSLRDFFVEDIARGRGMDSDAAMALADGRTHFAAAAVEHGLIDDIGTFGDAVASVGGQQGIRSGGPGTNGRQIMAEQNSNEPAAPASVAQLAEAFPGLVAEIRETAAAEALAANATDPVAAERERASVILAAATSTQTALAQELVANGTGLSEAVRQLAADPRREAARELSERMQDSSDPIDGSADEGTAAQDPEAELRAAFDADPHKFEGQTFDAWKAFRNASSTGQIATTGTKGN